TLPDLPTLAASAEPGSGLEKLVNELRHQLPPTSPMTLVAMPFIVVQRLDLADDGLIYRETWYDGSDEPHTAATHAATPLASHHEAVGLGEPVAAAQLGPVA